MHGYLEGFLAHTIEQRVPDLFEALRPAVDETGAPGQFLVLGSASRDLIRQSSESLAGRIAYLELTPFLVGEVEGLDDFELRRLWLRGGFPRSYLAEDDGASFDWRTDFVRTFIERDLPLIGPRVETQRMERLWRMAAHVHGQLLNSSKLGESLGVSYHTVRAYFELLEQTFVVRLLHPFEGNVKKRLVKSPKLYLRDAGVLHALLGIRDQNELLGHPAYGASFEGLVIEHALSGVRDWRAGFYRTRGGAEIDLVLERPGRRVAIECKAASAPNVTRGFRTALDDLSPDEAYVVAPVDRSYPIRGAEVVPLGELASRLA